MEHRTHGGREGVTKMVPLSLGLIPFGVAVGTAAAHADLPPMLGWASSVVLYGGSGQLALVEVLGHGGPALAAVAASLLVNLQMVLYGFGMRSHWSDQPPSWRPLAGYLLVGPVFAVTSSEGADTGSTSQRRSFYLGAGLTLWFVWLAATGAGFVFGTSLPDLPVIGMVTPLVLSSMAIRSSKSRRALVSLLVGAAVTVACRAVPYDLGFVAGACAGVAVGLLSGPKDTDTDTNTEER